MAKAKEEIKDVEVKKGADLVVMDFEEDAGVGLQLSAQDLAIPFISILQQLSPQLKRDSGVKGAVSGAIFNTVTQEVIDGAEGIVVIPCAYDKKWVEWKPRETGGGFVKNHETDAIMASCMSTEKGEVLPSGNFVIPTAYYYVLLVRGNGVIETAVLSMVRTQLKKSKKWNSIMKAIMLQGKAGLYNPPMFSHKYRLTTVEEQKNQFSWYGWEISNAGQLTDKKLYELAKKLNSEVSSGKVAAKPVGEEAASDNTSEVM